MYILWTIVFAVHIVLNLIILDKLHREDSKDIHMLPRSVVLPLFLAIITLRWKTGIHPAADKNTIRLMKAGNVANVVFIAGTLLVILFNL